MPATCLPLPRILPACHFLYHHRCHGSAAACRAFRAPCRTCHASALHCSACLQFTAAAATIHLRFTRGAMPVHALTGAPLQRLALSRVTACLPACRLRCRLLPPAATTHRCFAALRVLTCAPRLPRCRHCNTCLPVRCHTAAFARRACRFRASSLRAALPACYACRTACLLPPACRCARCHRTRCACLRAGI